MDRAIQKTQGHNIRLSKLPGEITDEDPSIYEEADNLGRRRKLRWPRAKNTGLMSLARGRISLDVVKLPSQRTFDPNTLPVKKSEALDMT